MKYIIMCGGTYHHWQTPKQLVEINGEPIVLRTIRLLRECGVKDISISSNNPMFDNLGVPVLHHENNYVASETTFNEHWVDAFYPTNNPVCYIFGDVVFSPQAIRKIVDTQTEDIEFFASAPPFALEYPKKHAEPFALKVVNTKHLKDSVDYVKSHVQLFNRRPIMWELWQVIKGTPLNKIDYTNYIAINDYTCDIDYAGENKLFEKLIGNHTTQYMIHTMPKRKWYVEQYLIPSMLEQGIKSENISVFSDDTNRGNLIACMSAFQSVKTENTNGTWHLQDDVIISHDFKEQTEKYDYGIVCAFKSLYDPQKDNSGIVNVKDMWFSFPCIRIPNDIAIGCADWVLNQMIGNPIYKSWWEKGVNDDLLFRQYVWQEYKNEKALNLAPNIVEHIDWLIGGTVNSKQRKKNKIVRSKHWEDEYLVTELKEKLKRK